MTASFRCCITNQRLSILDYDETRNNGRFRALINEDKVAVIQIQTLETADTPDVSQLSLCPGVLESEVLMALSQSLSNSLACSLFLIEKAEERIMYR